MHLLQLNSVGCISTFFSSVESQFDTLDISDYQTRMWTIINLIKNTITICFFVLRVEACREMASKGEILGYRCPETGSTFTNTPASSTEECTMKCIYSPDCVVANYNDPGDYCILFPNICPMAQYDAEFIMIPLPNHHIPHEECLRWLPFAAAWPTGRVVVHHDASYPSQLLTRGTIGAATVIGKMYKDNLQLWTAYEGQGKRVTNNIEYFGIHPTCFGRWVSFESGMGGELPSGTVKGGALTDGTPLYVAKAQHPNGDRASLGYYHPRLDAAVIAVGGEEIREEMEILIVSWKPVYDKINK